MRNNAPNFDVMSAPDLRLFAQSYGSKSRKKAADIFPDKPKGFIRAARNCAHYAYNKATAIDCRLRGEIKVALEYEAICDRIYKDLPAWARW